MEAAIAKLDKYSLLLTANQPFGQWDMIFPDSKQRVTGTLVHEQLLREGYQVGSTTVRAYLAEQRRARQEVYVPLVWRAGEAAQVDFFEVTVEVAGERQLAAFPLTLPPFPSPLLHSSCHCRGGSKTDRRSGSLSTFRPASARQSHDSSGMSPAAATR